MNTFQFDFNATEYDDLHVDQVKAQLKDAQESWEKYQAKDKDARSRSIKHELVNYMKGLLVKYIISTVTCFESRAERNAK